MFVIFTCVVTLGNFIVTATDPSGPWSEPIVVNQGGIDPSLFFDDDGTCYFTGTYTDAAGRRGIGLMRIDPFTGERLSEPVLAWQGMGGKCPEAPHLYKIDGWYYLMIAEGGTEYGHSETIARAKLPEGPYAPCPRNPILTHARYRPQQNEIMGTGHADLVQTQRGDWWMVFLAFRCSEAFFHHLGRETFLAPVRWESGWPVVNGGRAIEAEMDAPELPTDPIPPVPERETFAEGIGAAWNWLRNPVRENYRTGANGLTLIGSPVTLDDGGCPTFLGRRQEQFDMRCGALLIPRRLTADASVGLTVYYNESHHFDLFMRENRVVLQKRVDDLLITVFEAAWQGPCELSVTADRTAYHFAYGAPGQAPHEAGAGLTRHVSTEVTGCTFTGVYLGLFAQGDCEADFPWFDYRSL